MLAPWKKSHEKSRQLIKKQRYCFPNKGPPSQSYGFSNSHVWMWEFNHKESWALKNWCFRTLVLEKILESPLDCKEIKTINSRGNHSWIFIGRTDAEAEALILCPPDGKNWLIVGGKNKQTNKQKQTKTLMLGKIEGRRRRGQQRMRWLVASLTWWTWVWGSSGSWWWTGKPGVLQSMGSERIGHNWSTELNW